MIPASIRHRNPGAMYPGPSARRHGSMASSALENGKHKIATFPSHEAGAAALFDLLARGYADRTLQAAITRWCGGNYAAQYLAGIEAQTGLGPRTWIDRAFLADPERAIPLAVAMARHEAGQDYPLTREQWADAHATALASFPVPVKRAPPRAAANPEWTPDNAQPSPRPEARVDDAAGASRKHALSNAWSRIQAALGLGVAGTVTADQAGWLPSAMRIIKQVASDNGVLLVICGLVAGLVVSETVKSLTKQDIADGRYTPAGDQ